LKIIDSCALQAKFEYGNELEHLICKLIKTEHNVVLLGMLIEKYENIEWAAYAIMPELYKQCLSLNKTNTKLFKKFSDYISTYRQSKPKSVEMARQIIHLIDQKEFDKALELVNQILGGQA